MTNPPERPNFNMTVSLAAEKGTRRDLLIALQRRLIAALEDERTQPRDLSPLVLRLQELAVELVDLDAAALVAADAPTPDQPFDPGEI